MPIAAIEKLNGELPLKEAYQDLVHPTAEAVGTVLSLPVRAVRVALAKPLKWVMQGEANLERISQLVAEKAANIPEERIVEPEPYVAVPALQSMTYCMDSENIREMYANLLAKSIDTETKDSVHPSFVEMIKQMSPLDAELLKLLAPSNTSLPICDLRFQKVSPSPGTGSIREFREGVDVFKHLTNLVSTDGTRIDDDLIATSLENLCRLGLYIIQDDKFIIGDKIYDGFEHLPLVLEEKEKHPNSKVIVNGIEAEYEFAILRGRGTVTNLGSSFAKTCIE